MFIWIFGEKWYRVYIYVSNALKFIKSFSLQIKIYHAS